ncbi:MAG: L-2-hydroxyglutarate oxidase [Chloroflexi bacterium]|nr:L-2-hydroxyglutarate oxidase [Chloroflexota bacterium]
MVDAKYDVAIIGAGIIGLSTAMHLLQRHPNLKVGIVEKNHEIASQQTGHNSGVIHSGIYYRPGSFKAQFCVEGRQSMVRFCEENGIDFNPIGKVIIANSEEELARLDLLHERGTANGVPDLQLVEADKLKEIEPHVVAKRALWAPHTGIVNYKDVSRVYLNRIEDTGGTIHLNSSVRSIERNNGITVIHTSSGDYEATNVVNCAGLHSDRIASMMGANPGVKIVPFRGEYYTLKKESERLVKGLIYPVPDPDLPFLGVHFTHNIKGYVEAGPNAVLATAREGYRKRDFSPKDFTETMTYKGFWKMAAQQWKTGFMEMNRSLRKSIFVRDLQKMIPEIQSSDLGDGGSGVRAQAVDASGRLLDDFVIEQTEHSVHVLNAPSPGATSSLVIGRHITELADQAFSLN